jgi:hypothetical protein
MSKKGTKTIETKIGSTYHPKNGFEIGRSMVDVKSVNEKENHRQSVEISIRQAPREQSREQSREKPKLELNKKPVAPVPEVKLSPLRSRFQERSVGKVPIQEQPHPLTLKKDETKPRKRIVVDVKSPPKVFKSPTWYKSPSKKVVTEENVCLKQLLLKDHRYTEQDIQKILEDHK